MDGPETSEMYEAGFQEYLDDGFHPRFDSEKREAVQMENCLSSSPSLYDHLNWQASLTFSDPEEREIAVRIIGDINEDGYLTTSAEELAALCRTTPERVEAIRLKIKCFDPVGCGSLNLGEALVAQLDQLTEIDDIARRIIKECSPLLEKSDFAQISKHFEIPFDELRTHIDLIRSLDPAPGRKYSQEKTNYVVPDLTAEKVGDDWVVTLNDEGLPHLRISQYYRQLLARAAKTQPEASIFLKENLKKALWFLRSPRPAQPDHLQGGQAHHRQAEGLPGKRHGIPQAHDPDRSGPGGRRARVDRGPGRGQQAHPDPARGHVP